MDIVVDISYVTITPLQRLRALCLIIYYITIFYHTSVPLLRYRVEVPADKQWGTVRENGTVTGMVGEVAKRRTYFAIDEITITGK